MMKAVKISITLCLLIAAPVLVQAQSASKDFPNDKAGPANVVAGDSGKINIRAILKLGPDVKTGDIELTGPLTGAAVAVLGSNRLCEDAIAESYACAGIEGIVPCAGAACCDTPSGVFQAVSCDIGGNGFSLSRSAGALKFEVGTVGASQVLNALNHNTNAGNTVGTDPQPVFLVRVDKRAVNGVVGFSVTHLQGGANPRTFNVDTTGLNDLSLHQAIGSGFEGLGLGLDAIVHPATQASTLSYAPESLNGYFVEICNAGDKQVQQINVGGLEGQNTVVETNVHKGAPEIPALGPGGMLFLTLLLTLTGAWMLHRRRREA